MCLRSIDERKPPAEGRIWKVFRLNDNGELESEFYNYVDRPLVRGEWMKAERNRTAADVGTIYESGWHGFTQKRDAKAWAHPHEVVVECLYRGGRLMGDDLAADAGKVIVADELYIPKEGEQKGDSK